ncbi:hypothetical protein CBR_g44499 [Chara braunii]|uniref:Tyrosinase copper-binding domain-containing protein n=1 Tax=Chara braunii TaxID=69332 RepID=A0A388LXT2_CHABU|nr:hypothetical protein CBR_g44499 [Chara braunii]|eukprot:GBG87042.1 hypothetical protein CBR_g44499 [Chara braunii]
MAVAMILKLGTMISGLLVWGIAVNLLLPLHSAHLHVLSQRVPLPGPDLRQCLKGSPCCLQVPDDGTEAVKFERNASIPVRERLSAKTALQSSEYVKKLAMAYRKMRELQHNDPEDPRGMEQQRLVHCVYCSGGLAYGREYDVHNNWFFLPWHRMYLYFHERILAAMVGDPDFRLVFWSWDSRSGREFPAAFRRPSSPLFDRNRNDNDWNLRALVSNATRREMLRTTIVDADTHELFLGRPLGSEQGGLIETGSHNAIHAAVGRQTPPFHNMGNLSWAAADPVFFAHHANVDRLWWVWLRLPTATTTRRCNPPDHTWRCSRFVFYDENAVLTSISVKDVLETEQNLRYTYEDVENDWLPSREQMIRRYAERRRNIASLWEISSRASTWPTLLRAATAVRSSGNIVDCPLLALGRGNRQRTEPFDSESPQGGYRGDSTTTTRTPAHACSATSEHAAAYGTLVVSLDSFHLSCQSPFLFHVYITCTYWNGEETISRPHYLSSLYSFPASGSRTRVTRTVQFPIAEALGSDLDLWERANWTLRIVPQELGTEPMGTLSLLLPSVRVEWLYPTITQRRERP